MTPFLSCPFMSKHSNNLHDVGLSRNPHFSSMARKAFPCPKSQDMVLSLGPWTNSNSITWELGSQRRPTESETHG